MSYGFRMGPDLGRRLAGHDPIGDRPVSLSGLRQMPGDGFRFGAADIRKFLLHDIRNPLVQLAAAAFE